MTTKLITSYEVLAQPLAPVPNVPFVTQGSFLQISNLEAFDVTVDIEYDGTPTFVKSSGSVNLDTNYITKTGIASATSYNVAEFLLAPVGFKGLVIPPKNTWLFGVQYIAGAPLPSPGIDARGFIRIKATPSCKLLLLATVRQVFTNFNPAASPGTLLDIAEGAYSVPIVGGPEVSFA